MHKLILCALAGALLFAACGGDDDNGDDDFSNDDTPAATAASSGTPQATAPSGTTPDAQPTQGGQPLSYDAEPALTIDQNKKYFATIKMDIGDIKLELFAKDAPRHVNSFVFLAREGFYDGVTFHRVLPGFVAQAGDPTGTGSGGPGYTIPLEVNANKHIDGALGMARTSAPDTAGSQFFIDYGPQPALDPSQGSEGYTVFGGIVEGRDVLDKITARDPSKPADRGITGTKINTIIIEEQ